MKGPSAGYRTSGFRKSRAAEGVAPQSDTESDTAVILEVDNLEIRETRVEILDSYNELKLVALIEVVSPTNKAAGPGRTSYKAKQRETLARDCHLIEIDVHRQAATFFRSRNGGSKDSSHSIRSAVSADGRHETVSSFTPHTPAAVAETEDTAGG